MNAAPATGILETIDGRPALRFERRLEHSVERVWRAVSEPAELGSWFPGAADWTPEAGEVFEGGGQAGEITELDAPNVLAWTFAGDLFRFELKAEGPGCLLAFTHVFGERDLAAQTAAGWETYLSRLDEHLAGRHLSEERAHDPIGELHERYAERLEVDPAPGRRFIAGLGFRGLTFEDGPSVRLERRYRASVERLWRALTDPDELRHWFPGDLELTESEPPRLLAGLWYGDALRFELQPEGEGCVFVFTHSFADRGMAARDAAGWDRCFARLDALLGGQPMGEAASLELCRRCTRAMPSDGRSTPRRDALADSRRRSTAFQVRLKRQAALRPVDPKAECEDMRQAVVTQFGGPGVLVSREAPDPVAGPGEVVDRRGVRGRPVGRDDGPPRRRGRVLRRDAALRPGPWRSGSSKRGRGRRRCRVDRPRGPAHTGERGAYVE